jgi:hypothetical protein
MVLGYDFMMTFLMLGYALTASFPAWFFDITMFMFARNVSAISIETQVVINSSFQGSLNKEFGSVCCKAGELFCTWQIWPAMLESDWVVLSRLELYGEQTKTSQYITTRQPGGSCGDIYRSIQEQ